MSSRDSKPPPSPRGSDRPSRPTGAESEATASETSLKPPLSPSRGAHQRQNSPRAIEGGGSIEAGGAGGGDEVSGRMASPRKTASMSRSDFESLAAAMNLDVKKTAPRPGGDESPRGPRGGGSSPRGSERSLATAAEAEGSRRSQKTASSQRDPSASGPGSRSSARSKRGDNGVSNTKTVQRQKGPPRSELDLVGPPVSPSGRNVARSASARLPPSPSMASGRLHPIPPLPPPTSANSHTSPLVFSFLFNARRFQTRFTSSSFFFVFKQASNECRVRSGDPAPRRCRRV